MIMPLLTQLIQQAITDAFQANGVPAAPAADVRQKHRRRKKKVRGKPGCLAGQGAKGEPGQIVDSQADQASGKPSAAPVKGKGKSPSGSDSTQPSQKRKGKGNGDKPPSQAADPDAATHNAKWTLVTRRAKDPEGEFQLRAQDWSAPLVSFQGLGKLIEGTPTGSTVQGVILASKDQLDTAAGMLESPIPCFTFSLTKARVLSPSQDRSGTLSAFARHRCTRFTATRHLHRPARPASPLRVR